jgi:hypothetical protein
MIHKLSTEQKSQIPNIVFEYGDFENDIDKFKKIVPPNLRVFYRIFFNVSKYFYFSGESENLYPFTIHDKHCIRITHFDS